MSTLPAPVRQRQAPAPEAPVRYVGLATRAIAFALDAAVINLVAIVAALGAALILSLVHLPGDLKSILQVLGGAAYIVWAVSYFAGFWSATGQTPGARMMQIRVLTTGGAILRPSRALLRCAGTLLAALPLFAGFLPVLLNARRRAFQDWLAGTVVVEAEQLSIAAARRARMRASDAGPA